MFPESVIVALQKIWVLAYVVGQNYGELSSIRVHPVPSELVRDLGVPAQ
jgi:hypothetical protein